MANDDKEQEFIKIFTEEAADLVASLSATLSQWEKNLDDHSLVVNLKRDLHTLKGSARMVGQAQVGTLAHELEALCESIEKKETPTSHNLLKVIQLGIDRIELMIEKLNKREELADASDLINKFRELLPKEKRKELESESPPKKPEPSEKKGKEQEERAAAEKGAAGQREGAKEISLDAKKLGAEHDVIRIRTHLLDQLNSLSTENSMLRVGLEQYISKLGSYITEMKQEAKRLEIQLNTLSGELQSYLVGGYEAVPARNRELVQSRDYERFSSLEQIGLVIRETTFDIVSILKSLTETQSNMETLVLNQGRVSAELQHRLSDTRLTPFDSIVPRLGRIARQIATELKKEVDFKVLRTEGEMDRTLLERLIPSLEHILRNSIDHGIESKDIRKRLGKPEVGSVTISFSREGSIVMIEIADDGAGIDIAAVRVKAIKLGMLSEDAEQSDDEIIRFILEPGFSTKESVTEISGRGIGMDVVNTAIKELGGSLSISSVKGSGTKIIARFPFTTSLNRILVFSQKNQNYGILLTSVDSVITLTFDDLQKMLAAPDPTYEQGEKRYHLHYLGSFLEPNKEIIHIPKRKTYPLLLISTADYLMALLVDNVLYSRELIVQTLGAQFKLTNEFSGATILGDGTAVFILDPFNLCMKAKAMLEGEKLTYDFEIEKSFEPRASAVVMVVDDSISVRAVTKRLLERYNYQVLTAKDGVDALQQLEVETPDLILLDLDMPRMDGFEFAEAVRSHKDYKNIPIIVITSRASPTFKKRSDDMGLNGFIKKPYQEHELLSAIEGLIKNDEEKMKKA